MPDKLTLELLVMIAEAQISNCRYCNEEGEAWANYSREYRTCSVCGDMRDRIYEIKNAIGELDAPGK